MLARTISNVIRPFRVLSLPKTNVRMFSSVQEEYKPEIDGILAEYESNKLRKQGLVGVVVSAKCHKSITVKIFHDKIVPKYLKTISVKTKVMAHDEENKGKLGDLVRIVPCRPMSKKKRHSLIDIIKRPETVTTANGTVFSTAGKLGR